MLGRRIKTRRNLWLVCRASTLFTCHHGNSKGRETGYQEKISSKKGLKQCVGAPRLTILYGSIYESQNDSVRLNRIELIYPLAVLNYSSLYIIFCSLNWSDAHVQPFPILRRFEEQLIVCRSCFSIGMWIAKPPIPTQSCRHMEAGVVRKPLAV